MKLAFEKRTTLFLVMAFQVVMVVGTPLVCSWGGMRGGFHFFLVTAGAFVFSWAVTLFFYFRWLKVYNACLLARDRDHHQRSWYIREVVIHLNNLLFSLESRDDLFGEIVRIALETIPGADHGTMMVLGEDDHALTFVAAAGFDLDMLRPVHLILEDTYLYRQSGGLCNRPVIVRNKQVMDIEHQNKEIVQTLEELGSYDYNSTLTAPIVVEGELLGILNVDSDRVDAFDDDDVVMMEYFTNQIGVAIRNHDLMEKALQQSRFDSLTGLFSRQYFEELLELVMEQNRRKREGFQLVMFDLNDFKPVNDDFGHAVGDALIKRFAARLQGFKRDSDLVGRLGGDEFIAAYFYTSEKDLHRKMEELASLLRASPLVVGDATLTVSFSYGVASFPQEGKNLKALMSLADKRMYRHKQVLKAGR